MPINTELVKLAQYKARQEKTAFIPSDAVAGQGGGAQGGGAGGDPAAGGAPAAAGGGAPPGGDPAAGGGSPPPPPSGGASGGGSGAMPGGVDLMSALPGMIQQGIQTAMQQQGMGGGKVQSSIKPAELDSWQTKRMLMHMARHMGIEFPDDIINGPNRDPMTGQPMAPGAPGSTSDPATMSQAGPQPQSAIKPVQPMQGAFPSPGGAPGGGAPPGGAKTASDNSPPVVGYEISGRQVLNKAAAVARMCRQRAAHKEAVPA
jgi:hypothetical protein